VLEGVRAGAVLAAVLVLVVPAAWPAALALLAGAAGLGLLRFRDAGWRLDGRRITVRERRLGRSTLVARRARLQRHATSASPLQRRAGLAAFELAVGSGAEGHVDQVDAVDAARLYAELRPARMAPAPRSPPAGPAQETRDGLTADDAPRRTDEPEADARRGAEPGPPRADPGD
jgi:putative membrane protein